MVEIVKALVWCVVLCATDAYAVWLVWGWHGVAIGLPPITIWRAMGVSALWAIFALRVSAADAAMVVAAVDDPVAAKHGKRVDAWRRGLWCLGVAVTVLFAWIAHVLAA